MNHHKDFSASYRRLSFHCLVLFTHLEFMFLCRKNLERLCLCYFLLWLCWHSTGQHTAVSCCGVTGTAAYSSNHGRVRKKATVLPTLKSIKKYIFMYLLGCLGSWLWQAGSFVVIVAVCGLSSCSATCGILVPWPGIESESSSLEGGFLNTEAPGNSLLESIW